MKKLYHGTTIESALSILKDGYFKGTKKHPEHEHAYISFSSSFESAFDFGEIVFTISPSLYEFIEVEYENKEWMLNNREILEYIGVWYESEEETQTELHAIQFECEFITKNDCACNDLVESITIVAEENQEVKTQVNQIKEVAGDTFPVHICRRKKQARTKIAEHHMDELQKKAKELEAILSSL